VLKKTGSGRFAQPVVFAGKHFKFSRAWKGGRRAMSASRAAAAPASAAARLRGAAARVGCGNISLYDYRLYSAQGSMAAYSRAYAGSRIA
jgi:hypothetical protein